MVFLTWFLVHVVQYCNHTPLPGTGSSRRSAKFKEILLRLLIVDRGADVTWSEPRGPANPRTHGAVVRARPARAGVYLECDMVNVECKLVM